MSNMTNHCLTLSDSIVGSLVSASLTLLPVTAHSNFPERMDLPGFGMSFIPPANWSYEVAQTKVGAAVMLRPPLANAAPLRRCRVDRHDLSQGYPATTQSEVNRWFDASPITAARFTKSLNSYPTAKTEV